MENHFKWAARSPDPVACPAGRGPTYPPGWVGDSVTISPLQGCQQLQGKIDSPGLRPHAQRGRPRKLGTAAPAPPPASALEAAARKPRGRKGKPKGTTWPKESLYEFRLSEPVAAG
jgi:hypothetical protein